MEVEDEGWDPMKLVKTPSNLLLTVLRRYFGCGTFYLLFQSVSLANVFLLTIMQQIFSSKFG